MPSRILPSNRLSRAALLAVGAALAAGLARAGCGSDDDTNGTGGTAGATGGGGSGGVGGSGATGGSDAGETGGVGGQNTGGGAGAIAPPYGIPPDF